MWWNKDTKQGNDKRIVNLIEETKNLNWQDKPEESLQTLYSQCLEFIREEMNYYDEKRGKMSSNSRHFRIVGLVFGTAGILAPVLDFIPLFWNIQSTQLGYPCLVVAGASFTANSLFGGTIAHARYAKAQLNLEKWLALTVLEWNKLSDASGPFHEVQTQQNEQNKTTLVKVEISKNQAQFNFLIGSMEEAYDIILNETEEWSLALNDAMSKYQSKIGKENKA